MDLHRRKFDAPDTNMSSGQFAAFQDDASDSSSSSDDGDYSTKSPTNNNVVVPSFEDLSTYRQDEETVLDAVYGGDFTRKDGAWGCPELLVNVKPPDIEDQSQIGSKLQLSVQLTKQYPYVIPKITLKQVKGLSKQQQSSLLSMLKDRATELSLSGSVMVCELVQITEDYLLGHNQDPTLSAWEQMKQRQKKEQQLEDAQRAKELTLLTQQDDRAGTASDQLQEQNHPQFTSTASLSFSSTASSPISSRSSSILGGIRGGGGGIGEGVVSSDVERELSRQMHALAAAAEQRRKQQQLQQHHHHAGVDSPFKGVGGADGNNTSIDFGDHGGGVYDDNDEDEDEDDDDFDFDDDYNNALNEPSSYSRYKADFVELGILGRGGGGEVVKVRNRLDRRICK